METFTQMFLKIADKILDKLCTDKNGFSFTKIEIQFSLPCMALANCHFLIQQKKQFFHDCRLFIAMEDVINNVQLLSKILINVISIIHLDKEISNYVQK